MLLAVDTSTRWIGIALYKQDQVLGEMVWQTRTHHSVELAPAIASLQKHCNVTSADLQALGVALGPGSFTSLRIGLAVVKGLALGLGLPVVGVPSFDILAAGQPLLAKTNLMTILQAGRGRSAVSIYSPVKSAWKSDGQVEVVPNADIPSMINTPTLVCGEMDEGLRQSLEKIRKYAFVSTPANCIRRPALLAEMAWQRWKDGQVADVVSLAPIYVHAESES
jgi:tRNA threonylcarbamoyladenosine biosynthesis protein TsaB